MDNLCFEVTDLLCCNYFFLPSPSGTHTLLSDELPADCFELVPPFLSLLRLNQLCLKEDKCQLFQCMPNIISFIQATYFTYNRIILGEQLPYYQEPISL